MDNRDENVKILLGYAKNYFGPLGVTVVSMVLLVGVQLLAPWAIKMMIAAVKDQAGDRRTWIRLRGWPYWRWPFMWCEQACDF